MATRRATRTTSRRKTNRVSGSGMYVDGNAVRKLQEVPERRGGQRPPRKKAVQEPQKTVRSATESREIHRQIKKNREKAEGITRGFIIFLTIVCILLLPVTVQYLRLKAEITTSKKHVAVLESELTGLKEENDAYYSQVTNNVDMSKIKKIAIGRLGMKYPTDEQTQSYQTARSSYVRQYQDLSEYK